MRIHIIYGGQMMYTRIEVNLTKSKLQKFCTGRVSEYFQETKSEQQQKNPSDSGTKLTCVHDLAPQLQSQIIT